MLSFGCHSDKVGALLWPAAFGAHDQLADLHRSTPHISRRPQAGPSPHAGRKRVHKESAARSCQVAQGVPEGCAQWSVLICKILNDDIEGAHIPLAKCHRALNEIHSVRMQYAHAPTLRLCMLKDGWEEESERRRGHVHVELYCYDTQRADRLMTTENLTSDGATAQPEHEDPLLGAAKLQLIALCS
eukprot:CAMPEP_0174728050 /NCGR_PEP_ID=MMETSP1094-20130205/50995_1 /TAXON_ID=156173 /ORGANISM="Chrysochromulina brevifilum, Strain UTEX LB 985" /LENGTH=186 /DNA_ID=CAMNT_0015929901 /DNA_START=89 /DNA_END=651 /DNA_ORIENTATION=-